MKMRRIKIFLNWLFLAWIVVPIVRAVSHDDDGLTRTIRLRQLRETHDRRKYRPQSMGIRMRTRQKRAAGVQNEDDNDNAGSIHTDKTDQESYETRTWQGNASSSKTSRKAKSKGRSYSSKGKRKGVYYKGRKKRKKKSSKKKSGGYSGKGSGKRDDFCEQYNFKDHKPSNEDRKFRNIFDRTRPVNGKGGFSYQSNRFDHGNGGISGGGKIRNIFDRDLFFRRRDRHVDDRHGGGTHDAYCDPNVLEVARQNPSLSAFVRLVEQAGLDDIFGCPGPFTVLVPTNEAFRSLDTNAWGVIFGRKNKEALRDIVLYHIIPGSIYTSTSQAGTQKTLQGKDVEISLDPIMFNDSIQLEKEAASCNGIIYVIGDVLIPPSFGTFHATSDFSVLSPQALTIRTPLFPMVSLINDGPSEPEVPEICSMLDFRFPSGHHLQLEGELCYPNILQVAQDDAALSIFVSLIERSRLEEIFLCAGPFTTLIPTNDAFAAMDPMVVAFLLHAENGDLLRDFLLYHIIGGLELATEIVDGPLVTLQGQIVEATKDPVTFNGDKVLEADIPACNGVIDKLENVMVFPGFPALPPAASSAMPTFAPVLPTFTPTPAETPVVSEAPPTFAPTPEETPGMVTGAPTPRDSWMITIAPTADGSASTAAPTPNGSGVTTAPTQNRSEITASPTTTSSPSGQHLRVRLTDYYIALVVPALEEEPSQEVVDSLFNATTQFWNDSFEAYYADSDIQYHGLDNAIVEFLFDADLPAPGFNMYFEWDTVVLYELGSPEPPGPAETFGIMADADLVSYILEYVRAIPELETTNEVDFRAVERIKNMTFQRSENEDTISMGNISHQHCYEAGAVPPGTEDDSLLCKHSGSNGTLTDSAKGKGKQLAFSEERIISSNFSNKNATVVTENADLPSPSESKEKSSIGTEFKLSDPQSQLFPQSNNPSTNVTRIQEEIPHSQLSRNETLEAGEEIHENIYCSGCIEALREGSRVRVPPAPSKVRVPQVHKRAHVPQKGSSRVIVPW